MTTTEPSARADLLAVQARRPHRRRARARRRRRLARLRLPRLQPGLFAACSAPVHLKSTRRAFLYIPREGDPRLLIHHVDAGNIARLGLDVSSLWRPRRDAPGAEHAARRRPPRAHGVLARQRHPVRQPRRRRHARPGARVRYRGPLVGRRPGVGGRRLGRRRHRQPPARRDGTRPGQGRPLLRHPQSARPRRRMERVRGAAAPRAADAGRTGWSSITRRSWPSDRMRATRTTRPTPEQGAADPVRRPGADSISGRAS